MKFGTRSAVFGILALLAAAAAPAQAGGKDITWNIRTAGDFMLSAAEISAKVDDDVDRAPARLDQYDLTSYWQFHRRFTEDLDFLIAVNDSHVFVAFRGTTYTDAEAGDDAHTKMNNDGQLVLRHFHRVHRGWWRAAKKAWEQEIRPVLDESGKDRKILITGHSMGGAVAAYVMQQMLHDSDMKDWPVRLVTFGAPRYTLSRNFFPRDLFESWYQDNFYVYTVEATKENRCVDYHVYDWQKALRDSYPVTLGSVDLPVPKNKTGDNIWHGRCQTDITNYKDLHDSGNYHGLSQAASCDHIELRSDCATYKGYVD